MPKLHFIQLEFTTHSCDLPEGTTKVGRSSRNDLVLGDASVSADHCGLVVSGNEVIVRDHGSSNGTWVAGVRVPAGGQLPANHGAVIRFGRVEARLELDGLPADDATAVTANFGASLAAAPRPDTDPVQRIVGRAPSGDDTRNPTNPILGVTDPPPATPVTGPRSLSVEPEPDAGPRRGWWWKAVLLIGFVLAAAGLLRMSR